MNGTRLRDSFWTLVVIAGVFGCNGNNKGSPGFAGVWDVRYNLATDDCQLVTPGITGFVSEHEISDAANGTFSLATNDTFMDNGVGSIQGDGSLIALESIDGDLFGDGSFCSQETRISYSELTFVDATTQFEFKIECNDGFICVSQALGQATRRPDIT